MRILIFISLLSWFSTSYSDEIRCEFTAIDKVMVKEIEESDDEINFAFFFPKLEQGVLYQLKTIYSDELTFFNRYEESKIDELEVYGTNFWLSKQHKSITVQAIYHLNGGACYSVVSVKIDKLNVTVE